MFNFITLQESKQQDSLHKLSSKPAAQSEDAVTVEKIDKIIGSHEKERARVLEKSDGQRQHQTEDMLKGLAQRRKAQVEATRAKHKQEV